jgi:AcrR family transcriptional regulator
MVRDRTPDPAAAPTEQPRRRADAQRNIDAIVAAARDLLGQGALPSMSQVAAAAGVGRVTLYAHFPSREVLLDAVVRQAISDTDQALTALGLDDDAVEIALARLVRTSWPILDRYRTVRTVAVTELGPEALRDRHDQVVHHVERLIARGRATASSAPTSPARGSSPPSTRPCTPPPTRSAPAGSTPTRLPTCWSPRCCRSCADRELAARPGDPR